jgi:hypothetical protein
LTAPPNEETTTFALWIQDKAGPIGWQMLRTAFLQEQLKYGGSGPKLLPTARPWLCSLLVHEFEMHRLDEGCRLLLVPDRLLVPGKLYRFSFWIDLEDRYATPNIEAFCKIPRSEFFLFSQSRRAYSRPGYGRLSYFVAVPKPTPWAMRLLLLECEPELAMFRSEQRSERSLKRKRRQRHATRRERRLV